MTQKHSNRVGGQPAEEDEPLLTPREVAILMWGAATAPKGLSETETAKIIKWAEKVRIDEAVLYLVLTGAVYVRPDPYSKREVIVHVRRPPLDLESLDLPA